MPYYDRCCRSCGWIAIDVREPIHVEPQPCPECHALTERAWLTKPPAAHGDEMDHIQVNGLKEPRRFRFKSDRKRWLRESGWIEADYHCPAPGSDKGQHTRAWTAGGAQWLKDAETLALRNGTASGKEPSDDFHVEWSGGTLTAAEVERYRNR